MYRQGSQSRGLRVVSPAARERELAHNKEVDVRRSRKLVTQETTERAV